MYLKEQASLQPFLKIHPEDNVLVALRDLPEGEVFHSDNIEITLRQAVAAKHKFFTHDMNTGDSVIMYGTLVGKIQTPVAGGGLMTTENTRHAAGAYAYRGFTANWRKPDTSRFAQRNFMGYRRSDGRVGTANYWLFIPMVFCENRNLDIIREALQKELGYSNSDKYHRYQCR